ncbi:hypothetical protein EMCRGX_G004381 [Ephydatia muelleri]|eukprot:Em0007g390a
MNESRNVSDQDHIVFPTANGVSILVCLLAVILVFILKLHKKVVYRLALYQVLAAFAVATVAVLQTVMINYNTSPNVYGRVCTFLGWMLLYAEWMKLLFTMWVTFHLFCFAVFQKNLKKLEVLYVVTSLLVPAVIAAVPLITNSYGLSPDGAVCYMYAENEAAFIERFALWDGPALLMLLTASSAMAFMLIKLTRKVFCRSNYEPISDGDQFWKALKHLLPLAAFPILFLVFEIPVLLYHIYAAVDAVPSLTAQFTSSVFFSLWSTTSGLTLIVHVFVARGYCRKRTHKNISVDENMTSYCNITAEKNITGSKMKSTTHFSLPPMSI